MWKDYSSGYIKNNRSSCISIIAASLIATLLLSLVCSLFYNIWIDEINGIVVQEGDWQGRLTGELGEHELAMIRIYANVQKASFCEELSKGEEKVVDIIFRNARTIYEDMPILAEQLGLGEDAVSYHEMLLSRYLIHNPGDEAPPMLTSYFLAVLLVVSVSLILIIHNAFAMTMHARIHQFGILSTIGASPGQIRICLLQEAAVLSVVPVLAGSLSGIGITYGILWAVNLVIADMPGRHEVVFSYHPLIFLLTIFSAAITILISVWIPAWKLSRITPIQAVRNTNEIHLNKRKKSRILSRLFGIKGEIAGNALKAQKKALRMSAFSLTLSFLGFTVMMCFFTLSQISTRYTYFERYQDVWDLMVRVQNTNLENFEQVEELREIDGVRNCVAYQFAEAKSSVFKEDIGEELSSLGGPLAVAGSAVSEEADCYLIKAPLVILDDVGFLEYCEQIGVSKSLEGVIVLNKIWDSANSNFRYPKYVPFLKEQKKKIILDEVEVDVLGYAQKEPVLREEYDDYTLVQFLPLSLWTKISPQLKGVKGEEKEDTFVRILASEREELADLELIADEIEKKLAVSYEAEVENRIQDKITNDQMIQGYELILGGLCVLLAVIGIANLFSNTLGFLRQRKREFARYMSIGMTPKDLRKLFCIEAFVIGGKPVFITLPVTAVITAFFIQASYLEPSVFLAEAPVIPILLFILVIFGFTGLAYYLGGKKVLRCELAEALRDDTLL